MFTRTRSISSVTKAQTVSAAAALSRELGELSACRRRTMSATETAHSGSSGPSAGITWLCVRVPSTARHSEDDSSLAQVW